MTGNPRKTSISDYDYEIYYLSGFIDSVELKGHHLNSAIFLIFYSNELEIRVLIPFTDSIVELDKIITSIFLISFNTSS